MLVYKKILKKNKQLIFHTFFILDIILINKEEKFVSFIILTVTAIFFVKFVCMLFLGGRLTVVLLFGLAFWGKTALPEGQNNTHEFLRKLARSGECVCSILYHISNLYIDKYVVIFLWYYPYFILLNSYLNYF